MDSQNLSYGFAYNFSFELKFNIVESFGINFNITSFNYIVPIQETIIVTSAMQEPDIEIIKETFFFSAWTPLNFGIHYNF